MKRIVRPGVVKVRPFISNLDMKEFHITELRGRYHQNNFSEMSPKGTNYPRELKYMNGFFLKVESGPKIDGQFRHSENKASRHAEVTTVWKR